MGQTIDDLGVAGFTVNITELDIRICTGDNGNIQTQKDAYKRIVSTAFNRENCNTVLIWGSSDNDSWINTHYAGCGQATHHDENYTIKPAYFAIKEALMEL